MARRVSLADKRAAYRATFCGDLDAPHEMGRRVLAELRKFCAVDKAGLVVSPVDKHTDVPMTAYRDGLRDAYRHVVWMLGVDVAIYNPAEDVNDERNDTDSNPDTHADT